jgi:hypothetical protein
MDLTLDPEEKKIGGHVDFKFFNDTDTAWEQLCLRDYPSYFYVPSDYAGDLTSIENVSDSRTGALSVSRDEEDVTVLWIDLETPLAAGEQMTLSYDFEAVIPNIKDRFGQSSDVYNITLFYPILSEFTDGEWSHVRYFDAGECYFSETADYEVDLKVPSDYVVATSGEEISSAEEKGMTTYHYFAPKIRNFAICSSPNFAYQSDMYEDVNINVYYNEVDLEIDDVSVPLNNVFEYAKLSLEAFEDAYGEYPYNEIDIVLDDITAGGMEYPNLVIVNDTYCHSGQEEVLETVVVHEIAHQWFMGIVGSNSGDEPWLDESFASYSELVYYEYKGGDQADEILMAYSSATLDLSKIDTGSAEPLDLNYWDFSSKNYYTVAVYEIGKAMLYQMEEAIGREEFHSVIREYVSRYEFRNATTEDFLDVLYSQIGTDNETVNALVDNMLSTEVERESYAAA